MALTDRDDTLAVALGSRLILWTPETDQRARGQWLPGSRSGRWCGSTTPAPIPAARFGSARCAITSIPTALRACAAARMACFTASTRMAPSPSGGVRHRYLQHPGLESAAARGSTSPTRSKTQSASYDYDRATGAIANERVFFANFERGLPDGSAMDADGYLWNCRYYGGCIVRVAPDGKIDRVVEMPVKNITTCTFGGADLKTLFVTTASADAPPGDRLAGGLYAIQCEVRGQPENRFRVFPALQASS